MWVWSRGTPTVVKNPRNPNTLETLTMYEENIIHAQNNLLKAAGIMAKFLTGATDYHKDAIKEPEKVLPHHSDFLMGTITHFIFYAEAERFCAQKLEKLLDDYPSDHILTSVQNASEWFPWNSALREAVKKYHENLRETDIGRDYFHILTTYSDAPLYYGACESKNQEKRFKERLEQGEIFKKKYKSVLNRPCEKELVPFMNEYVDFFCKVVSENLASLKTVGMQTDAQNTPARKLSSF